MMTRILLIEDDADIREGVRLLLSAEGYEIIEADCGAKGLEQLDESIDLVILDVMMPGISGLKTCEGNSQGILCSGAVSHGEIQRNG